MVGTAIFILLKSCHELFDKFLKLGILKNEGMKVFMAPTVTAMWEVIDANKMKL